MKLGELIDTLSHIQKYQPRANDFEVVVVVSGRRIGGTPCTKIKSINCGFDWDNGKVMITTDDSLQRKKG